MADEDQPIVLPALAERRLFEPLRGLLELMPEAGLPGTDELNALLGRYGRRPVSARGRPIRFVERRSAGGSYEDCVGWGRVATRPGSSHDLFNSLVWLRFPRIKAALNARHLAYPDSRRNALRDAATHFDECGVAVVASDDEVLNLLRAHCWKALFWEQRERLPERLQFVVVGHALYDQLRRPFFGLCGKAVLIRTTPQQLERRDDGFYAWLDRELAARFASGNHYARPDELQPVPMLGIPGVVTQSADPAYYDDIGQFRPPRTRTRIGE